MPQTRATVSESELGVNDERRPARTGYRDARSAAAVGYRDARPAAPARPGTGVPGRRTVTIRGHGAEPYPQRRADGSRRPRPERRHERAGFRPDRAALWAFLLGVMLILVAVASAHAATL